MIERQDLSASMIIIEMQYDHYYSLQEIMFENIGVHTNNYGDNVDTCVLSANHFDVLNKEKKEIINLFELAAHFSRANFISFFNLPGEKSFEYLGKKYEFGTSDKEPSFNDPRSWLEGFYSGSISRNDKARDFLCTVDAACHYGGGVSMSEVYHKLVALLKAIYSNGNDTNERIGGFLSIFQNPESASADLDLNNSYNKVFFPKILVPLVELYNCVLNEGGEGFNERFESALLKHKEFWTDEDRYYDGKGWLSLPLLAVAIFAESKGISVTVESEYAPMWLIKGDL